MDDMNRLTEDRFTSQELDRCQEFGLSVGDRVLFRGEKCRVKDIAPLVFSMESDQHPNILDEWRSGSYLVGYYVISEQWSH